MQTNSVQNTNRTDDPGQFVTDVKKKSKQSIFLVVCIFNLAYHVLKSGKVANTKTF